MIRIRRALQQYVAMRRALGTEFREPALTLDHFVDFLQDQGAKFITTILALRWAQENKDVQRATWARRLSMVRRFAAWLTAFDKRTEIPPKRLIQSRHRRNKPHIYTDIEIKRIMVELGKLRSSAGFRALTYQTLVGLLTATGLRPGEALTLKVSDVDLHNAILTIRETKFGKTRVVPLHDSTCEALLRYSKRRNQLYPHLQTDAFLISEKGKRLCKWTVRRTFARALRTIGLRAPAAGRRMGRGPRLQDIRHTFATRKLVAWYKAGKDVQRELPKLATYLGHVDVAHTYWYIEAVPELLSLATDYLQTRKQVGAK